MNKVLRHEKKFLLNSLETSNLSNKIAKVLMPDPHNGYHGYIVRSLYFDTVYNRDFHQKDMGVEIRRKIRLRVYDPNDNFALLEMKQKEGNLQLKRSLKITREDAIKIINKDYSVLLKYPEDFATEIYAVMNIEQYMPVAVVQYNRKAYIAKENKIRITFDSNIIATESNFNIFDENLLMYPVFDKFNTVLEVKYNGFLLTYIKDLFNDINKSETSVSKYCLSRSVGMHYIYF